MGGKQSGGFLENVSVCILYIMLAAYTPLSIWIVYSALSAGGHGK